MSNSTAKDVVLQITSGNEDYADKSSRMEDTFWGHFIAGIFLLAYGGFLLGLTVFRLRRIIIARRDNSKNECNNNNNKVILHAYLEQHVPEQNPSMIHNISIALIVCTIFGLLYEGLGAVLLNRDLHPEYTVFHYVTHLTVTLLYLFVGWTGLLEFYDYMPQDSLRGAVVFALFGEVLLWYDHAASKTNPVEARIHGNLALISGITAILFIISMLSKPRQYTILPIGSSTATTTSPNLLLSFLAHLGSLLGIIWQGLWFFVAAIHQRHPILSTSHVTVFFVLQAMLLGVVTQFGTICLLKMGVAQEGCRISKSERRSHHQSKSKTTIKFEEYSRINNVDEENPN